jgi:hypothetical protein
MELSPRQIYYKEYYKVNKQHIMTVVLKYQSNHMEEKKAYYTKYNKEYFQKNKKMKPVTVKPPRQVKEKVKKIPIDLITVLDVPKEPKEKKQKKLPEIATITGAPKAPQKVAKEKPKYEHLKGNYTLSFD